MKKVLRNPLQKMLKVLLAGTMGFTCLQMTSLIVHAQTDSLKDEATIKKALEIYFNEPVSKGTLIPGRSGGFGTTEEDDRWQQLSLPIGNSMMGANIYGEISKEHVTFNQKTLWNGGPSDKRPDYDGGNIDTVGNLSMSDYIKGVQDKFLNGEDASADCNSIRGEQDGYGAYQSFGDIYLDFDLSGEATNYKRALDLNTALATVDFTLNSTQYHREYFASYPDNVIAMKVSAKGDDKLNFNVTFPIDNDTSQDLGKTVQTEVKDNTITVKGMMNDNQLKLNGKLKVITTSGNVSEGKDSLDITDASEAIIFVSAGTDYKNEYPNYRTNESDAQLDARIAKVIKDAQAKGYDKVKTDEIKDYTTIFDRVSLNLGQDIPNVATDVLLIKYNDKTASEPQRRAIETLLFQYGRYLQISSSRKGDLPANLQGVWNNRVGDANRVPWGSDYHMNVNLQMNYWPTYNTNMAECADPLIEYIDSLREPGRVSAEAYFGVKSDASNPENGFSAHTQNTPFGWTCPGWDFSWGWSPAAVPWILQNCYEQYEYTGDLTYLRDNIYPMLKEEAKLYQQILREDPTTGRLVTVPAYSPEHGPRTAGNAYEQSLVWQLFKDSIEAATALGVDVELVKEWKSIQDKLNPIEIGESGQIKEWYHETTFGSVQGSDRKHRHMSHLLGLFPGDLISIDNKEYLDAARVSLEDRGDDATGWGMGQRLNTWARLGDGNHAYSIIGAFFKGGAYPNLWDAHAPFQIDGNFGYTAGVAEMLVQSNMGYINLLPALPDTWDQGSVSGLVARGNFEVSMDWSKTNLTDASILSKNGGDCVLQYPNIKDTIIKHDGKVVDVKTINKDRISFTTKKGGIYTIENIPTKPLKSPENAKAYTDGSELLIDFDTVVNAKSYSVYSSTNGTDFTKLATIDKAPYKVNNYVEGTSYYLSSIDMEDKEGVKGKAILPVNINSITKMDDRDALIQYSSGWGDWSDSAQYMGSEKYTDTTGSTLEFYFSGTGLRVIGMKGTNTHTYDLYIDDKLVDENFDTNGSKTERQQVFSDIKGLREGIHKAKLVVTRAKISLDAFEIIRNIKPTSLSITSEKDTLNLNESSTLQLKADFTPNGAGEAKNVTWEVKNDLGLPSNIATINEQGKLSATGVGSVIVKVKENTTQFSAEKVITISKDGETIKYDDRDTSIKYGSGWSPWDEAKHEFGTITESTTKGSSFEFDFTGTNVALYFMKLEASAVYAGADIEIFIDGETQGTQSTYTNVVGSQPKQKVFEKTELSNGKHTVKVVMKDVSSQAPTGRAPKVSFDYYSVSKDGEISFDYHVLKEEIELYSKSDLSLYTDETAKAYEDAYKYVVTLYEVAKSQESVDKATSLMKEKREALKIIENTDALKETLTQKIKEAEKAILHGQLAMFDQTTQDAFKQSIEGAKIVNADKEAKKETITNSINALDSILKDISYDVNKIPLQSEISKSEAIDTDDYAIGVEAFTNALENANMINANKKATQVEVDGAVQALCNAKQALSVDKTALRSLIDEANAILEHDEDYKKDEQWTAFVKAIDVAVGVVANTNATQKEINIAVKNLKDTKASLSKIVHKEQLQHLIQAANKMKEETQYSTSSLKVLEDAIDAAQAIVDKEDASEAQVQEAYLTLETAIKNLEPLKGVSKKLLEEQMIIAEEILANKDNYILSTLDDLANILAKANDVYKDENATQAQVNEVSSALHIANMKAKRKANKAELHAILTKAKEVSTSSYREESVVRLQKVMKEGERIYANELATQEEVDSCVREIQTALDSLETKPIQSPSTGDVTSIMAFIGGMVIALSVMILHRRHKQLNS